MPRETILRIRCSKKTIWRFKEMQVKLKARTYEEALNMMMDATETYYSEHGGWPIDRLE